VGRGAPNPSTSSSNLSISGTPMVINSNCALLQREQDALTAAQYLSPTG
jgi:hypothetical protein